MITTTSSTNEVTIAASRKAPLTLPSPLWGEDKGEGQSCDEPKGARMHTRTWTERILTTAAFLIALVAAGAAPTAAAPTVDEAVQTVENHYRDLVDLTAKVVQKNHLKALDKTQTFDAVLWIRKPGKLRLDYSNGQVILVDGKAALFYSRKSEQVIKKTFSDIEQMNIPVAFLLGAAHIRDDFEVRQPDPAAPLLLELTPKRPSAAMKKLILRSDAAGRIASLDILDKAGNRTEIMFSDVQEGVGFDDKLFVFKAPKGTEVIEQ